MKVDLGTRAGYSRQLLAPIWFSRVSNIHVDSHLDPVLAVHRKYPMTQTCSQASIAKESNRWPGYLPVTRLVSSSSDAESLYGLLIRIATMDNNISALACRHALAALSYQYVQNATAAKSHQIVAIRALQSAVESRAQYDGMKIIAASLLLCIFEVRCWPVDSVQILSKDALTDVDRSSPRIQAIDFDSVELSWSQFFCGAKRVSNLITQTHESYLGEDALILDWVLYYDVLYKFSVRHWEMKNDDQIQLASQEKVFSKAIYSPERKTVCCRTVCFGEHSIYDWKC